MKILMRTGLVAIACLAMLGVARGADELNVLIIDGQNNHNWKSTTPVLEKVLEKSGRFTVDVVTTPPQGAGGEAWNDFRPSFEDYDVILSNYNGEDWPETVRTALEDYISGGGGLALVHAANNAFPYWSAWNEMIGLGWRPASFGARITIGDDGEVIRTEAGEGPGAGHGRQHPFQVHVRQPNHPIMQGLPEIWMHTQDELYHGQRGPAKDMTVLSSAFSAKETGGTGENEPMTWVIPYGQGRVFVTVLGHVMGEQMPAMECVGFRTILARGCEWAATGEVTLPVPKNFPDAENTKTGMPIYPVSGVSAVATQANAPLKFEMKRLNGTPADLSDYQGKVVLIVNTASKCGLTPQYEGLQKLHEQFADDGLAVLGFPANEFGRQEPGSNQEISEFCTQNYGVTFDMFSKVVVKGDGICPLYDYLTSEKTNPGYSGEITWNFEKFLIGRDGKVIARFSPRVAPGDPTLMMKLKSALAAN
ncbi:MAG: ThuA domain-containing protein [Planctomycetota bacterium]